MALTASDCFRIKFLCILDRTCEPVLRYTLLCGTEGKSPDVPLDEYLRSLPKSSTANFNRMIQEHMKRHADSSGDMPKVYQKLIRKQFNHTDLVQIRSDPSCSSFDIILLCKAIKLACENVAEMNHQKWKTRSSEMEYLVTHVKDLRNQTVHEMGPMREQDYLNGVKELMNLLSMALGAAKVRYNRDESEFTKKMDEVMEVVEGIKKEHVDQEIILNRLLLHHLPLIKMKADKESRERLVPAKSLDPLHCLSGHGDTRVDVDDIFSKIIINDERKVDKTIHHSKLLTLTQEGLPLFPHIMILEGDAGSGKTTLLTMVLAEWLKEQPHRHMEGLQHFDLLLWVVCREESSPTLESLVERSLPDTYFTYGKLLLPALKKCRVLILIDGLDEQNNVSRKLVKDIISQGKDCPTFTVVCTSRPEGIRGMKANISKDFIISHLIIAGLPVGKRSEVALKYFKFFNRDGSKYGDEAHLKQVMKQIGWKEFFRLPVNVLLVSKMCHFAPQKLTTTITLTKLYQYIQECLQQELLIRLVHHSQGVKRIDLQKGVERILSWFYEVTFNGLLQNNIYLSEKDISYLTAFCRHEGLPEEEVLSTLYSLRQEVSRGVKREKFCARHTDLQEFFAALHILGRLNKYKQGDIRRMVKDSAPEQDLQLTCLRKVFCHLLGLLSCQDEPMTIAMEETVDLIHESGVKSTQKWLTVLADSEAHPSVMARVAHHINHRPEGDDDDDDGYDDDDDDDDNSGDDYDDNDEHDDNDEDDDNGDDDDSNNKHDDDDDDDDDDGDGNDDDDDDEHDHDNDDEDDDNDDDDDDECYEMMDIGDGTVRVAADLLPLITCKKINIQLETDPIGIEKLATALAHHIVWRLSLRHHFRHPHAAAESAHLLQQIPRSSLTHFEGHLDAEHLALLPRGLEVLGLVVLMNMNGSRLLSALQGVDVNFPQLYTLNVHVPVSAVTPRPLTPLPSLHRVDLVLSSVSDEEVEAACWISGDMCPKGTGYWFIMFPCASLMVGGYRRLLEGMAESGVEVRWDVHVPETTITGYEERELRTLAKSLLQCCFFRMGEEDL